MLSLPLWPSLKQFFGPIATWAKRGSGGESQSFTNQICVESYRSIRSKANISLQMLPNDKIDSLCCPSFLKWSFRWTFHAWNNTIHKNRKKNQNTNTRPKSHRFIPFFFSLRVFYFFFSLSVNWLAATGGQLFQLCIHAKRLIILSILTLQ